MYFSGLMVSKSELKCSGHCFPVGESMNLLLNSDIVSLLVKTNMGREKAWCCYFGVLWLLVRGEWGYKGVGNGEGGGTEVDKVGEWGSGKVGEFWFYSRVGDER